MDPITHITWISLGSNQGNRQDMITAAVAHLCGDPGVLGVRLSSLHETAPIGGPPGQGHFLNAAAEVRTFLEPLAFFHLLTQIEQKLGRVRTERWGSRTIDLDLLLFEDQVIQNDELTVPHPRMHERLFVLAPLVEIAADVIHPIFHRTIRDLLGDLPHQTES